MANAADGWEPVPVEDANPTTIIYPHPILASDDDAEYIRVSICRLPMLFDAFFIDAYHMNAAEDKLKQVRQQQQQQAMFHHHHHHGGGGGQHVRAGMLLHQQQQQQQQQYHRAMMMGGQSERGGTVAESATIFGDDHMADPLALQEEECTRLHNYYRTRAENVFAEIQRSTKVISAVPQGTIRNAMDHLEHIELRNILKKLAYLWGGEVIKVNEKATTWSKTVTKLGEEAVRLLATSYIQFPLHTRLRRKLATPTSMLVVMLQPIVFVSVLVTVVSATSFVTAGVSQEVTNIVVSVSGAIALVSTLISLIGYNMTMIGLRDLFESVFVSKFSGIEAKAHAANLLLGKEKPYGKQHSPTTAAVGEGEDGNGNNLLNPQQAGEFGLRKRTSIVNNLGANAGAPPPPDPQMQLLQHNLFITQQQQALLLDNYRNSAGNPAAQFYFQQQLQQLVHQQQQLTAAIQLHQQQQQQQQLQLLGGVAQSGGGMALAIAGGMPQQQQQQQLSSEALAALRGMLYPITVGGAPAFLDSRYVDAQLVMIGFDDHFNVTMWNVAAEAATGFLESEAVGKPLSDLIESPDVEISQLISQETSVGVVRVLLKAFANSSIPMFTIVAPVIGEDALGVADNEDGGGADGAHGEGNGTAADPRNGAVSNSNSRPAGYVLICATGRDSLQDSKKYVSSYWRFQIAHMLRAAMGGAGSSSNGASSLSSENRRALQAVTDFVLKGTAAMIEDTAHSMVFDWEWTTGQQILSRALSNFMSRCAVRPPDRFFPSSICVNMCVSSAIEEVVRIATPHSRCKVELDIMYEHVSQVSVLVAYIRLVDSNNNKNNNSNGSGEGERVAGAASSTNSNGGAAAPPRNESATSSGGGSFRNNSSSGSPRAVQMGGSGSGGGVGNNSFHGSGGAHSAAGSPHSQQQQHAHALPRPPPNTFAPSSSQTNHNAIVFGASASASESAKGMTPSSNHSSSQQPAAASQQPSAMNQLNSGFGGSSATASPTAHRHAQAALQQRQLMGASSSDNNNNNTHANSGNSNYPNASSNPSPKEQSASPRPLRSAMASGRASAEPTTPSQPFAPAEQHPPPPTVTVTLVDGPLGHADANTRGGGTDAGEGGGGMGCLGDGGGDTLKKISTASLQHMAQWSVPDYASEEDKSKSSNAAALLIGSGGGGGEAAAVVAGNGSPLSRGTHNNNSGGNPCNSSNASDLEGAASDAAAAHRAGGLSLGRNQSDEEGGFYVDAPPLAGGTVAVGGGAVVGPLASPPLHPMMKVASAAASFPNAPQQQQLTAYAGHGSNMVSVPSSLHSPAGDRGGGTNTTSSSQHGGGGGRRTASSAPSSPIPNNTSSSNITTTNANNYTFDATKILDPNSHIMQLLGITMGMINFSENNTVAQILVPCRTAQQQYGASAPVSPHGAAAAAATDGTDGGPAQNESGVNGVYTMGNEEFAVSTIYGSGPPRGLGEAGSGGSGAGAVGAAGGGGGGAPQFGSGARPIASTVNVMTMISNLVDQHNLSLILLKTPFVSLTTIRDARDLEKKLRATPCDVDIVISDKANFVTAKTLIADFHRTRAAGGGGGGTNSQYHHNSANTIVFLVPLLQAGTATDTSTPYVLYTPVNRSAIDATMLEVGHIVDRRKQQQEQREEQERILASRQDSPWTKGRLLGRGAFGAVYEATSDLTGGKMAVKMFYFKKEDVNAEHTINIMLREIKIMCDLNHPNIVHYFYCERNQNTSLNLFMELCDGSIADLVMGHGSSGGGGGGGGAGGRKGGGPPTVENATTPEELRIAKAIANLTVNSIILQIAKALVYLHEKGITHRDIKPQNILLKGEVVKVTDFGTARQNKNEELTDVQGTFRYMAPEVYRGEPHSRSCDVWSLGCLAAELLGFPLNFMEQRNSYLLGEMTEVVLPPGLRGEGRDFVTKCLQINPNQRMQATMLQMHPFLCNDTDAQVLLHFNDAHNRPGKRTSIASRMSAFSISSQSTANHRLPARRM